MKKYAFFFHYNKPLSLRRKKPMISVHWKGACIFVEQLVCNVTASSRTNAKRQPRFVMAGFATNIIVRDKTAVIT